jgi:outer membrane protein TolC
MYLKSYITLYLLLFVPVKLMSQETILLSLEDVIYDLSLKSSFAEIEHINYENELLSYENYQKSFLPSVSFNVSPFSFNRSLVKLQQAEDGQYHYVEDYSGNSSIGLNIQQRVGLTGGNLNVNSNLNYLNEMSRNRHSFSSVPFSFSYSQKLFGSRKTLRMEKEIEKKKNEKALIEYCTRISDIQQESMSFFMAALLARLEIDLSYKNLQSTDTLLRIATVKYEKGNMTEQGFRQIELQILNDRYMYENAGKSLDEALQAMITYLGSPYEVNTVSVETPPFNLPVELNTEEVFYYVEKNNPEALNREISRLEAEKSLFTSRLNNLVNSDISLNYGINQYASNLIDAYRNPSRQQGVSVGLSIPVFQWGINRNNTRIAGNIYRSSQLTIEQEHRKFEDEIKNMVNNYNHNVNLWFISERTYKLSVEQYSLLAHLFSMGKASVYELINAHQEQSSAMRKYYNAIRDLWNSYFALRKVALYDFDRKQDLIEWLSKNCHRKK